jgi:hypothetical protein
MLYGQAINLIKSATGIMVMAETHGQSSGTEAHSYNSDGGSSFRFVQPP